MNKCLWCQGTVEKAITFSQLFFEKPSREFICSECYHFLEPVADAVHKCTGCSKISEKEQCLDCLNWKKEYPEYIFKHESLYYYNDIAKEFMEKYKMMGDCELSLLFSFKLAEHFKKLQKRSVIVPVPISENSRRIRGFNQVELLLESAGVPYIRALKNIGRGEKQARKNKSERMQMRQPFIAEPQMISQLEGASVILVDDLYTTGRTLFHAADALKSCSPQSLKTFSLFR